MISESKRFINKAKQNSDLAVEYEREKARLSLLVDEFAEAMKERLISAMGNNENGAWDDSDWDTDTIIERAHVQLSKEYPDPIDAANFCAFFWNRMADKDGES